MQTLLLVATLLTLMIVFIRVGDTVAAVGFGGVLLAMILLGVVLVMRLLS